MSSSHTDSDPNAIELPGFGLPVNILSEFPTTLGPNSIRLCFPNAVTCWAANNMTVRELKMLAVMNELTDKPEWERKVFDDGIVGKWKIEALKKPDTDFSEKMFDYCINELRDKASYFSKTGHIAVLDTRGAVFKSDTIIPATLAEELKTAVKPLEDVPPHKKDWHPQSNEKVLDLVHPSLYPLMYGKSRIIPTKSDQLTLKNCLDSCGKGVIVPKPDKDDLYLRSHNRDVYSPAGIDFWSDSYQWLPCEVAFRDNEAVEITSYINNLHPHHHQPLYAVLEKIIARTIPLWNDVLSVIDLDKNGNAQLRIVISGAEYEYPLGEERPLDPNEDPNDLDRYERDEDWLRANRVLIQPEPKEYKPINPQDLTRVDLRRDWGNDGIQVIVKLANIELRPEDGKTEYEGGAWHVEGQLNEHICASAIYYYDQSNVTESRLAFRQLTNRGELEEKDYPQDDYEGLEVLYGIQQYGPCVQTLGSVLTREGRMIGFPNVLQHQVQPFKLADPTKPGYRKILALFLIDPYRRIISTTNVPPQQSEWWGEVIGEDASTRVGQLPPELREHVIKMVEDWPISLEEAKRIRLDLMDQRRAFVSNVNQGYEEEGFSFCEH
ncbi:hypothetical protein E1B28_001421 [Marasmius oreades]|uniref:Uncharacterized protein n=1 Tax=Marasmius oreades TaxID=181124 RepID=A0A9P7V3D4_9AGAR|nr:uncharacterized protein E1B28_001421 [Marasmius oreades]KAG7099591.1 hypothetical protein E1B28_001421 [Marasmius oreades]